MERLIEAVLPWLLECEQHLELQGKENDEKA